jgi:hypothetical protein
MKIYGKFARLDSFQSEGIKFLEVEGIEFFTDSSTHIASLYFERLKWRKDKYLLSFFVGDKEECIIEFTGYFIRKINIEFSKFKHWSYGRYLTVDDQKLKVDTATKKLKFLE